LKLLNPGLGKNISSRERMEIQKNTTTQEKSYLLSIHDYKLCSLRKFQNLIKKHKQASFRKKKKRKKRKARQREKGSF
jgi:hypothetical protein